MQSNNFFMCIMALCMMAMAYLMIQNWMMQIVLLVMFLTYVFYMIKTVAKLHECNCKK